MNILGILTACAAVDPVDAAKQLGLQRLRRLAPDHLVPPVRDVCPIAPGPPNCWLWSAPDPADCHNLTGRLLSAVVDTSEGVTMNAGLASIATRRRILLTT